MGDCTWVFTDSEVEACGGRIRNPELVKADAWVHVIARCCGKNHCSEKSQLVGAGQWNQTLSDDNSDATVVIKSSNDGGKSWQRFQTLSPKDQKGYASGDAIWDDVRKQLVV